jgi:hypothetical protein
MAKKKRERTTSRMPSGAQQYTRGDDSQARLRNIDSLISSRRLANMLDGVDRDLSSASGERRALHEAFMDEASRNRAAYQNQMQASQDTRTSPEPPELVSLRMAARSAALAPCRSRARSFPETFNSWSYDHGKTPYTSSRHDRARLSSRRRHDA